MTTALLNSEKKANNQGIIWIFIYLNWIYSYLFDHMLPDRIYVYVYSMYMF